MKMMAIYTTTLDTITTRNSTSSHSRPKWQSAIIHTFAGQESIYHLKLRNLHFSETTRVKSMKKDSLWILLWRPFL